MKLSKTTTIASVTADSEPEHLLKILDLKCPICLGILDTPCEKYCGHLVCMDCTPTIDIVDDTDSVCPVCRETRGDWHVNRYMVRITNNVEYECPDGCGDTVTHLTVDKHRETCRKRYRCMVADCDYTGSMQMVSDHMGEMHTITVDLIGAKVLKVFRENLLAEYNFDYDFTNSLIRILECVLKEVKRPGQS